MTEEPPPIRVIVDTTRKCNLNCWYCHSSSGPNYKGPKITGENIRDIFETSEKNSVFEITLTGGEPTMWTGLNEAVEASHNLSYTSVQIITNAAALSQQKINTLKNGNFKRICISLDGPPEVHEKNRGKDTYAQTLKGITQLRSVVDNTTVISVIDSTSYNKWPELTKTLKNIGVKQHHLAPVCFAGNAMDDYRGLNEQQFREVRNTVEELKKTLPSEFILRFNDILISGPKSHTMSIQAFTEFVKGRHIVIRPNGKVNAAVRAWGRSWRQNETIGNINNQSMSELIDIYKEKRSSLASSRFNSKEERKRKFHLGSIADKQIAADIKAVQLVEKGKKINRKKTSKTPSNKITEILDTKDVELSTSLIQNIRQNPNRFRLRLENKSGFLFDTVTFNVTVLSLNKAEKVNNILS